ncbi:MAG: ATP-dependent DNA helicase RecG [Clostridia bacterium]|nr:ATP-dependent DNA helicase RecG [Clostridia bacterium]
MLSFDTDIRYLKGVGEKRAQLLKRLGVDTVGALLSFYPRSYKDLSKTELIYDTELDKTVCIKAKITSDISEHYIRKNMTLYKFKVADQSGAMNVTIFNNKYLAEKLNVGSTYLFYGKTTGGIFLREMSSPEIYEQNNNGILPVYSLTSGITSKYLSGIIRTALDSFTPDDPLPQSVREKYNLCDIKYALNNIHFPRTKESLDRARRRLIFEELFLLQCGMSYFALKRRGKTASVIENNYTNEFLSLLPFTPTDSQIKCIGEGLRDMQSSVPMNRLLQGDVGSGKTVVAAALCYSAAKNGFQSILMAPTVILAEQHFRTFENFFNDSDIKCALITGSLTAANKRKLREQIKNGEIDIVVGTNAILSDANEFCNVGLVITDEQHRFGVEQRAKLSSKGHSPHTLVMSATPIPRTLALVIYGDLDISILNEYPKGRQKIECYSVTKKLEERAYNYIKKHIDEGRQAYIVCPLVEEGETERTPAETHYKNLSEGAFKNYKLGLLHGKLSSAAKEKVMRQFSSGEIDLLISTTVIEVGIDVPNAAIMVILDADCFGLSQLHQLRGRIGRGNHKSTCILISGTADKATNERLSVICATNDGFKIAEEDLKLRGPGDFLGKRQHGLPELKIADMNSDYSVLKITQEAAKEVLSRDSDLSQSDNATLKKEILRLFNIN